MPFITIVEIEQEVEASRRFLNALESFDKSVYLTQTDYAIAGVRIRAARATLKHWESLLEYRRQELSEATPYADKPHMAA